MPRWRIFDDKTKDVIRNEYRVPGMSYGKLAKKYDVSEKTIYNIVRYKGSHKPQQNIQSAGSNNKLYSNKFPQHDMTKHLQSINNNSGSRQGSRGRVDVLDLDQIYNAEKNEYLN